MELEERLFLETSLDLAWAALVASGVEGEKELRSYLAKFDRLCRKVRREALAEGGDDLERAEALFRWLWRGRPRRHQVGGSFKLAEVVDAQLHRGGGGVGNCLGLTLLYNALGQRLSLELKAVYLADAFGRGPHVFSLLFARGRCLDVENVFPFGFDYRGHLDRPHLVIWGGRELVADIYVGRGNQLFERGEFEEALARYNSAIRLNPRYPVAYLNKGMALCQLGRVEEAEKVFEEAQIL